MECSGTARHNRRRSVLRLKYWNKTETGPEGVIAQVPVTDGNYLLRASDGSGMTEHGGLGRVGHPGGSIMKQTLMASALAGTLALATIATPTSAHAQWGRGWGWGLGGLAVGLTIGALLSRPAYAYGYGYPAYSYGYGYPGYGYSSYGYGYPAYSYASYGYGYPAYGYGYGGGYYRPVYRSAYYGGYRPVYRPAVYGGYRVARRVAIHRARWR
jgi:hypothetical protein